MSFPLIILLYIYLALLLVWLFFMVAGVYHMIRFGFKGFVTVLTTIIFIGVAVLMLSASATYVNKIDWETEISLFGNIKIDEPAVIGY